MRGLGPIVLLACCVGVVAGASALHEAVQADDLAKVTNLLAQGTADLETREAGGTPLHFAALKCHGEKALIMKALIDAGARIQAVMATVKGVSTLHIAAMHCKSSAGIKMLLEAGADVKAVNADGATALHSAGAAGNFVGVKVLLEAGASVTTRDKTKRTGLHWAAISGNAKMIKALLAAGSAVDDEAEKSMRPLHYAAQAQNGGAACVKLLLAGADVEARDEEKMTPLLVAAASGSLDSLRMLLVPDEESRYAQADVNATDAHVMTVLHHAAMNGHADVIKALVHGGAAIGAVPSIQAVAEGGFTPIHVAALSDQDEAFVALAELGADLRVKDEQGRTPMAAATTAEASKVIAAYAKFMKDNKMSVGDLRKGGPKPQKESKQEL